MTQPEPRAPADDARASAWRRLLLGLGVFAAAALALIALARLAPEEPQAPFDSALARRLRRDLLLTFLLSGFWHGASWNFVLWGAYHGLLLIAYRGLGAVAPGLLESRRLKPARVLVMFALVNVGWLMFRETETSALLRDLFTSPFGESSARRLAAGHLLSLTFLYSLPLMADSALYLSGAYRKAETAPRAGLIGGFLGAALLAGIAFFYSEASSDFIYFQF